MQLTRFSDLGLRLLMYLSQQSRPQPITIAEVAGQYGVPQQHLVKVAHRLGQLGWVRTQRGRGGGLSLAVPAGELPLGAVLAALEGRGLIDCSKPNCSLRGDCRLKGVLDEAMAAFYRQLDQYTLADVCQGGTAQRIAAMHIRFLESVETSR